MTLDTFASNIAETAAPVTGRVLVVDAHRSREATAKNQGQHNLALTILTHQFRLLQAAISERT